MFATSIPTLLPNTRLFRKCPHFEGASANDDDIKAWIVASFKSYMFCTSDFEPRRTRFSAVGPSASEMCPWTSGFWPRFSYARARFDADSIASLVTFEFDDVLSCSRICFNPWTYKWEISSFCAWVRLSISTVWLLAFLPIKTSVSSIALAPESVMKSLSPDAMSSLNWVKSGILTISTLSKAFVALSSLSSAWESAVVASLAFVVFDSRLPLASLTKVVLASTSAWALSIASWRFWSAFLASVKAVSARVTFFSAPLVSALASSSLSLAWASPVPEIASLADWTWVSLAETLALASFNSCSALDTPDWALVTVSVWVAIFASVLAVSVSFAFWSARLAFWSALLASIFWGVALEATSSACLTASLASVTSVWVLDTCLLASLALSCASLSCSLVCSTTFFWASTAGFTSDDFSTVCVVGFLTIAGSLTLVAVASSELASWASAGTPADASPITAVLVRICNFFINFSFNHLLSDFYSFIILFYHLLV